MGDLFSTLGIPAWFFYRVIIFYTFAVATFFAYKAAWAKYLFTVMFVIFAIGAFVNSNSATGKVYVVVMVCSLILIELLANWKKRKQAITSLDK